MPDVTDTVIDDTDASRFRHTDDERAHLAYRTRANRLVLVRTEVPDELEGQGVGSLLVRAALERAASSGETLVPACPFARKWLEDHPDEAARAEIDWREPQG